MTSTSEKHETHPLTGKYLTFALSRERYGVEILKVQEIIGVPSITRVPLAPGFIRGVINLRGKIIPVVDLRLKLGMEPQEYDERTCIIVVNITAKESKLAIGAIVDRVLEVVHFGEEHVEATPDYGTQLNSQCVMGMAKKDDTLNILLNIEMLMSTADSSALAEMSGA